MKKEIEMYNGDMIATYNDTQELRDKVFNKVMAWFTKNSFSTGESMQNDNFSIEAPEIMADILDDIICFETKWVDGSDVF